MLVGRHAELGRIGALVEAARTGNGGALVLTGPAGIGKSALLEGAAAAAGSMAVIRATGVQAERDVPYAGLHALLAPLVRDGVPASVPEPQRRGLAVALGATSGTSPGRLILGAATLGVLAAQPPLVLLVDDLQWMDRPSADALCFAARRLVAETVAVVATARADGPLDRSFPAAGLPTLQLPGLSDVGELVPEVHPEVARALSAATGGNPLAVLESAAALTPEEARGLVPLPRQLPLSNPERFYAERLSGLGPRPRSAARILALAGRAPRDVLTGALAGAGLDEEDLSPLDELNLCRLQPSPSWRHPLARGAAARGTRSEVRRAHAVLAAAWGPEAAAARAWHLAESVEGPDVLAAAALERAALDAEAKDASADAADAWERAARLTSEPGEQSRRVESAAGAALRAGATRRAAQLLDEALLQQPNAPAAGRLLHQRARIEHTLGKPERALDLFLQAVDLAEDPAAHVWAAAEGLYAAMYAGRPDQATRMARLAHDGHDPEDLVQRFLVAHARGGAAALNHDVDAARGAMGEARDLLGQGALQLEPDLALWAVNIELFDPLGDPLPGGLTDALDRMRRAGDMTWLPRITRLVAVRAISQGRWSEAQGWLEEAEIVARMSGQDTQLAEALLLRAELDAVQGRSADCANRLSECRAVLDDIGIPWLESSFSWVECVALLTRGHESEAVAVLQDSCDDPWLLPLAAELSLRTTGAESARKALQERRGIPPHVRELVDEVLDRDDRQAAAALVASTESYGDLLTSAIARAYAGERLRRAGDRLHARELLRAALEVFAAAGAGPWVGRVEQELRASGATLRRRPEEHELTPSEQRVAAMVAEGLSNKEVAAALYLSPKTVEFHLGRVYRKLGVTNRTALSKMLSDGAGSRADADPH